MKQNFPQFLLWNMLNILFALNDSAKKEKVEKLFNFILNNTILDKLNVDEFFLNINPL